MIVQIAVAFVIAGSLSWLLSSLELIPWRRAANAHWTERARQLFPARVAVVQHAWLIPAAIGLVDRIFFPKIGWAPLVLAGSFGTAIGAYPFARVTVPGLNFKQWFHWLVANVVTRVLQWLVIVAAILFMPENIGWQTWFIAGLFLAIQIGYQFGFGLFLLRTLRLLRPADLRLTRLVEEISARTGVALRSVRELAVPEANAFAYIATRDLVFTSRILEILPEVELRAVCEHEFAHLAESRWVLVGRIVGSLAIFPAIFYHPVSAHYGKGGVAGLALTIVAIWCLRPRLAHAMEKRADRQVVATSSDPAIYARSLERIHRANQMPVVLRNSSLKTHPDIYDRMLEAKVTPDYPRPWPPASFAWSGMILTVICTLMAMFLVLQHVD